jgi:hypothetical protein
MGRLTECGNQRYRKAQRADPRERELSAHSDPPSEQPIGEKPEHSRHDRRLPQIELRLKAIMYDGQHANRIDELVQPSPAMAAEAADHPVGRGRRQCCEASNAVKPIVR